MIRLPKAVRQVAGIPNTPKFTPTDKVMNFVKNEKGCHFETSVSVFRGQELSNTNSDKNLRTKVENYSSEKELTASEPYKKASKSEQSAMVDELKRKNLSVDKSKVIFDCNKDDPTQMLVTVVPTDAAGVPLTQSKKYDKAGRDDRQTVLPTGIEYEALENADGTFKWIKKETPGTNAGKAVATSKDEAAKPKKFNETAASGVLDAVKSTSEGVINGQANLNPNATTEEDIAKNRQTTAGIKLAAIGGFLGTGVAVGTLLHDNKQAKIKEEKLIKSDSYVRNQDSNAEAAETAIRLTAKQIEKSEKTKESGVTTPHGCEGCDVKH